MARLTDFHRQHLATFCNRSCKFWCTAARVRAAPASPPPHAAALRRTPPPLLLARILGRWIANPRRWSNSGDTPSVRSTVDPCARCTTRSTAHARVHGRWICDPRCGCGVFIKGPLSNSIFTCRSFHLIGILHVGPGFCKLAPAYLG
jgi:hypothetical protein